MKPKTKFKKTEITEEIIKVLNEFMPQDKKLNDSYLSYIQNLITSLSKFIYNQNNKNLILGKKFLKSSKENLDIAKYSYENKMYSSAIFNLTLATEKLVKAYGLIYYGINLKDLKWKIGHKSPMTCALIMEREPYKSYLEIMKSFYPSLLNKDAGQLKEFIENKKKQSEILKGKSEKINKVLDIYEKIREVFNDQTKNQINQLIDNVFNSFNLGKKTKEKFNFDLMPNLSVSFCLLAAISFITFPHYFTSNYPEEENINYDENLGIVQCFNRINGLLLESYNNLTNFVGRIENAAQTN